MGVSGRGGHWQGRVIAGHVVLAGRTWALAGAKESRGFPTKDEGKRVWEKGRSQREGGIQTLPVSGVVG